MVNVGRREIIHLRVLVFRHDLVHGIKILRDNWQLTPLSPCLKPSDGCLSLQSNQITTEIVMEVYDGGLDLYIIKKMKRYGWTPKTVEPVEDEEWDNDRIWDKIEDDYYLYNDDDDYYDTRNPLLHARIVNRSEPPEGEWALANVVHYTV